MHWKNNSGNIKFESAICNSIKSGSKLWCLGPASMQVQVSVHTVAQTASGIAQSTGHWALAVYKSQGHWTCYWTSDIEPVIVHTVLWTSKQTFVKWCGWSFLNESIIVFMQPFIFRKSLWNIFYLFYKALTYEGFFNLKLTEIIYMQTLDSILENFILILFMITHCLTFAYRYIFQNVSHGSLLCKYT